MGFLPPPSADNSYYYEHVKLLLDSYSRYFGEALIQRLLSPSDSARAVYEDDFPILSHNCDSEPKFNYANRQAQLLFEGNWSDLIGMPSSCSAETADLPQRSQALSRASRDGYVNNYHGRRVTLKGVPFVIKNARLWKISDTNQKVYGQAVLILESSSLP